MTNRNRGYIYTSMIPPTTSLTLLSPCMIFYVSYVIYRVFLFNMMVNFFKGYHVFIRPPESASGEEDGDDVINGRDGIGGGSPSVSAAVGRGSGGGGGRAGQGQESDVEFDVLGFLSFAKPDVRPFLRVLLRTKAFAAFLRDAR